MPPNNQSPQNQIWPSQAVPKNQNSIISQDNSINQINPDLAPNEFAKHSMPKFGKILAIIIFTTASVILLSFGIVYLMKRLNEQTPKPVEENQKSAKLQSINLQPVLDQWLTTQVNKKNSSVLLYDLNNQEIIGRNNDFSQNNSLGVENLFLIYLSFLRINQETWKKDDPIKLGEESLTRETCLTKIIQENHAACKDALISEIGIDELKQFLKDQSYENTNFTLHLSSSTDLLNLAKRFFSHPDFSDELWQELKLKLDPKANAIAASNPLLSEFQKLKVYGTYGASAEVNSNFSYINNLYFLETNEENPTLRRTIVLIYLATDTNTASVIDLAKSLEQGLTQEQGLIQK